MGGRLGWSGVDFGLVRGRVGIDQGSLWGQSGVHFTYLSDLRGSFFSTFIFVKQICLHIDCCISFSLIAHIALLAIRTSPPIFLNERKRLKDKMKQLDASITSLQKKKNKLTGATKKQQRRVTSLKESIARHVSKLKNTDSGLDDKINTILNNYKIVREVYHGGDFNGVN